MQYVRALVEDQWAQVPYVVRSADPQAEPQTLARTLVMAREVGLWRVNSNEYGVRVTPGLVVSFNVAVDADFFLASPSRASKVYVTPGDIIAFHNPADAEHFIGLGQAEPVSREKAEQELAAKSAPTAAPTRVVAMNKRAAR